MPALLKTRFTWSVSCCATTSSRKRSMAASSATSQMWTVTRVPSGAACSARSLVRASPSSLTSHVATEHPSAASWTTSSRPIPEPPPVTTARSPSNESIQISPTRVRCFLAQRGWWMQVRRGGTISRCPGGWGREAESTCRDGHACSTAASRCRARRRARPRRVRGAGLPCRLPARWLPRRRSLLHVVGLPHHPSDHRRPRPRSVLPEDLLGTPGPTAASRVLGAHRRGVVGGTGARAHHRARHLAGRRVRDARLRRQLVADRNLVVLLRPLLDAEPVATYVEPRHRGAALRALAPGAHRSVACRATPDRRTRGWRRG